jgi:hypothetical protein
MDIYAFFIMEISKQINVTVDFEKKRQEQMARELKYLTAYNIYC